MRNIAALIIGAIALTCSNSNALAQGSSQAPNGQRESFTFVLELDDAMIETLRNGEDLLSAIPAELQSQVTEVRLRYVGDNRTADRRLGTPATTTPRQPISTNPPFNSNRGFSSNTQTNQGSDQRLDSSRSGNPANGLLNRNQQPTQNRGTVPQFTPRNRSTLGGQSGSTSRNDGTGLVPTTPRNQSQYNRPIGPTFQQNQQNQQTIQTPVQNPFTTPSRQLPTVDPGGFQPRQPSNTDQGLQNGFPRQPTNNGQMPQTRTDSQYDTSNSYPRLREYPRERSKSSEIAWDQPAQSSRQPNTNQQNTNQQNNNLRSDFAIQPVQNQQHVTPYANNPYANNTNPPNSYGQTTFPRHQNRQQQNRQQQYTHSQTPQYNQHGYQPGYQPPYQPPHEPIFEPSIQQRSSLIAGHDIPMPKNHAPRVASRNHEGSGVYNQRPTGTVPTASIRGNNVNAEPYVEANDYPNESNGRTPMAQLNQFNNFLYFLLLCSIGLNIYLAWISRGFYVRYRELADELRDTFSTV